MPRFSALALLLLSCPPGAAETPRFTTLKHPTWVGAVAFSPDGRRLATASADGAVRLWEVKTGGMLQTFKGHDDIACAVAWSADGASLVTGGYDGTVRLWQPDKDQRVLHRRRGPVMTVAFATDGKTVAAGGLDGIISLLDPASGRETGRLLGHKSWVNSVAFSGSVLASGSSDGTARLWDLGTRKAVMTLTLPDPREVRGVALSPDGKMLAAGVRYGTIRIWDVGTGQVKADRKAHDGDTWSLTFTRDGKTLVSGGGDWGKPGTIKLWDLATWKERATLPHSGEVLSVAVSGDGRHIAAGGGDGNVRVFTLTSGAPGGSTRP